ncbi:MAG: hypothetical protein ABI666_02070 [Ferruginibacter sp.]
MSKYNTFLAVFIISVVALIFFLVVYLNGIFAFAFHTHEYEKANPLEIFSTIFSPAVIISGLILGITSLVYRILGIVHVAKNKTVTDGEKALWIIGFIIMGFVAAIVFLIMAKGRKFVD